MEAVDPSETLVANYTTSSRHHNPADYILDFHNRGRIEFYIQGSCFPTGARLIVFNNI
jgi:hypothetical protein